MKKLDKKIKYFTKVTTDEHHELFEWCNKKPLRWAVLMTMSSRVASKDMVTKNIKKGEFFFSETEYKKFGLKKSQSGNLRNLIFSLAFFKIIQKVENRKGNRNSTIYRFINSDFIDCSRKYENTIENKMRTERELNENRMRQTKNVLECKNDKNVIKKKNKKEKIKFLKYVFLYDSEYEILLKRFGKNKLDKCIEKLDSFIPNSKIGKNYKDHYRAILGWVSKWYDKENKENQIGIF